MDIKRLFNFPIVNPVKQPSKNERVAKFDSADERDANGQEGYQRQKEKHHEPMTEEQLQRALEELRGLPAVKEHNWKVQLEVEDGKRFVSIKDNMGHLIRKIPEIELWTLDHSVEKAKGQLFKRTA